MVFHYWETEIHTNQSVFNVTNSSIMLFIMIQSKYVSINSTFLSLCTSYVILGVNGALSCGVMSRVFIDVHFYSPEA